MVQWWEQNLFLHFLFPLREQGVKEEEPSSFLLAIGNVQGTWLSMLGTRGQGRAEGLMGSKGGRCGGKVEGEEKRAKRKRSDAQ